MSRSFLGPVLPLFWLHSSSRVGTRMGLVANTGVQKKHVGVEPPAADDRPKLSRCLAVRVSTAIREMVMDILSGLFIKGEPPSPNLFNISGC